MILAAVLLLASRASDVGSGAALTLVLPLALLVAALAVWFVGLRRSSGK